MFGFVRRWFDGRRCKKMGKRGISVGTRMDGSIDVDIAKDENEEGWSLSNLDLDEAEFLHGELGRVIARQRERGYLMPVPVPVPVPEPEPELPPITLSEASSGKTSEP